MRALMLSVTAALLLATPVSALDLRAETKSYPAAGVRSLALELPAGEVTIETTDGPDVRLTVGVHGRGSTSDCERRARRLHLDAERRGDALALTLKDGSHWRVCRTSVRTEVRVPRGIAVELKFGAGELQVFGLDDDLEVKMGAGEAILHLRESDVGAVRVRVGAGDATLHRRGEVQDGSGFISRTLHWGGPGPAQVRVLLGAGDVDLRLE